MVTLVLAPEDLTTKIPGETCSSVAAGFGPWSYLKLFWFFSYASAASSRHKDENICIVESANPKYSWYSISEATGEYFLSSAGSGKVSGSSVNIGLQLIVIILAAPCPPALETRSPKSVSWSLYRSKKSGVELAM